MHVLLFSNRMIGLLPAYWFWQLYVYIMNIKKKRESINLINSILSSIFLKYWIIKHSMNVSIQKLFLSFLEIIKFFKIMNTRSNPQYSIYLIAVIISYNSSLDIVFCTRLELARLYASAIRFLMKARSRVPWVVKKFPRQYGWA